MKKLILLSILLINALLGNAQFVSPVIQDNGYGVSPIYSRNTGCDIMTVDSNTYRVSVWGNAAINRGLGWVVDYNGAHYVGTLPLTYSGYLEDPDVCLITKSGPYISAAVAYYDSLSQKYYLEFFTWDNVALAFVSSSVSSFWNAPFGTTLNIDGNSLINGEFSIVWDDASQHVYCSVGNISSGLISTNFIASGSSPDVSLYVDGGSDLIHVCYIDNLSGDLTVSDYNFSDLVSNTVSIVAGPFSYPTSMMNYKWDFPRIASPGPNGGSPSEWTVVALEREINLSSPPNNWYIRGYNNGTSTIINYNVSLIDISKFPNYYSSVCYSNNYPSDGIYVGWSFYSGNQNFNNVVSDADYSIVLSCNNNAIPIDSLFWQVPYSITSGNYDISSFLSLAGRHADNELFATYQNISIGGTNIWDVNYKMIKSISSATSFKSNQNISPSMINSSKELLQKSYYSLDGKLLFTTNNKSTDVLENYFNHTTNDIIIEKSEYGDHTFRSKKLARFNH